MPPALARTVHDQGAAPRPYAAPARSWWGPDAPGSTQLMVLLFAVCAAAAAAFAPQMLWDGDTLWHLTAGDWMWAHHQVTRVDTFSYTALGRPWINLEWLSEVIMAPVHAAGGWSGLQLFFALALGALTWILGSEISRKLPPFSCAVALFLILACTTQSWLARPHILALPILALWTVQLLRAREAGRSPPLWLLPVMTVWANLHGSFLFGLALIGPFALEALVDSAATDRMKTIRAWGLFGVLALLASLITPHGVDGIVYPIKLMTMRTLPDIVEWQSSNFSHLSSFETSLLAVLFILLYRGVKIPVFRLITVLGLLYLTLHETRHQMVLAVTGGLLLVQPIGEAMAGSDPIVRLPKLAPAVRYGVLAAILVVVAGVSAIRFAVPATLTDGPTAPITALAHVPPALRQQPMLNEYGVGGYLIYNHMPPFIDGRADMYGDDFIETFLKAKTDPVRMQALIARYGMRWSILATNNPGVGVIDALPGWKRIYADKWNVVQVKTGS